MLIDREGVLEDTENIEELKRRGVVVSIKESDLARIDMHIITDLIAANIVKENLDKYENSVSSVIKRLNNKFPLIDNRNVDHFAFLPMLPIKREMTRRIPAITAAIRRPC